MPPASEPPQGSGPRFACAPPVVTLTRCVTAPCRTKTSQRPFVSPGTRFRACELNRTARPFALIAAAKLSRSPVTPELETLTRVVAEVAPAAAETTTSAAIPMRAIFLTRSVAAVDMPAPSLPSGPRHRRPRPQRAGDARLTVLPQPATGDAG